ncbi:MAG TPA: hypothetical protein VF245_01095 [Solirubrobacterales bacterium]
MPSQKVLHLPWAARPVRTCCTPAQRKKQDGSPSAARPLSTSESQPEAFKLDSLQRPDEPLTEGDRDSREPHSALYPDALENLSNIFGTHLADVLVRHRKVETLTGEKNVIGRQNLVEALAHLGTLFARAEELDRDKQLEQVAFLGDHLRRVMMESFEVEVYATIGAHWNEDDPKSIGRRYDAVAAPLIKRGKLLGVITPEEVQARFDGLSDDIVQARRAKIADGDWSIWTDAADSLEAAAAEMRKLKREMGAAVDAATSRHFNRRLMIGGAVLSVVLGAALTLGIQAFGIG